MTKQDNKKSIQCYSELQMKDIFSALKPIYWTGKLSGSISFSIHGSPKLRKLLFSKFDNIFFCIQSILLIILLVFVFVDITNINDIVKIPFHFELVLYLLILLIKISVIFMCFLFNTIKRQDIVKLLLKLDNFCQYFDQKNQKINYNVLLIFNIITIFLSLSSCLINFLLEYIERGIFAILIMTVISSMISNSMEIQICVVLYVTSIFGKYINLEIIKSSNANDMELYMKNIMNTHGELSDFCKDINNMLDFMLLRILAGFLSVAISCFRMNALMKLEQLTVGKCVQLITLTFTNLVTVVLIIFSCEITKYQVIFYFNIF